MNSKHTKEALQIPAHPNIAVFRHPDHAPSGQVIESEFTSGLKHFSLNNLGKLPEDALKTLYGQINDVIFFWAHHEKLCLIDGKIAFMGGLDLCFGRWDTNSHPIADAHPTDVDQILFPGQDYNNARVYDFEDVTHYMNNKLDRTKDSRMGWSDLSMCLQGPMVEDLRAHFVQRWNFIYNEKYDVRKDKKYQPLRLTLNDIPDGYYKADGKNILKLKTGQRDVDDPDSPVEHRHTFHLPGGTGSIFDRTMNRFGPGPRIPTGLENTPHPSGISVQLVRSCTKWSNGVSTEVS